MSTVVTGVTSWPGSVGATVKGAAEGATEGGAAPQGARWRPAPVPARRRPGPGMLTAVRVEIAKMRRLRTVMVAAVMAAATVMISSTELVSATSRARFDDPSALPWAALLQGPAMFSALVGPVFVAVLASRQTDIEHSGAGWNLAATAGVTPGALCRAKVVALALVIAPVVLVQNAVLALAGRLAGITVPFDTAQWAAYTLMLIAVHLVMCAFHVWLAAVVDNQLVVVGAGLLGGFLAFYMLLAPAWVARMVPWGYYAMINITRFVTEEGGQMAVQYASAPVGWILGFLGLSALVFAAATRRLDRAER